MLVKKLLIFWMWIMSKITKNRVYNPLRIIINKLFHKAEKKQDLLLFWESQGATIGKNFQFNSGYPIDGNWPWLITIGDNVTLASDVKLLAHDASTAKIDGVHTKVGIVSIGDNVFIGANTVVLCNVRIGDNVVVGANSVVTKDLPSNGIYAGNPAKFICTFEEYSEKHKNYFMNSKRFNKYNWTEWPNASFEDKIEMREMLNDTFGYL